MFRKPLISTCIRYQCTEGTENFCCTNTMCTWCYARYYPEMLAFVNIAIVYSVQWRYCTVHKSKYKSINYILKLYIKLYYFSFLTTIYPTYSIVTNVLSFSFLIGPFFVVVGSAAATPTGRLGNLELLFQSKISTWPGATRATSAHQMKAKDS